MKAAALFLLPLIFVSGCTCARPPAEVSSVPFSCLPDKAYRFINGVNVAFDDASDSNDMITGISGKTFVLAYNFSEGSVKDIGQALKQKLGEYDGSGEVFLREVFEKAAEYLHGKKEIYNQNELEVINELIKSFEKKDGVLVSHSQGNFFANMMCDHAKRDLKVVHIANPSSIKTRCSNIQVTFSNDPVIVLIEAVARLSLNPSLAPITPNERFEKGRNIEEGFIRSVAAGLAMAGDSGTKDQISEAVLAEVFYNHELLSYVQRDPSAAKKIRSGIAAISTKDPDKVIPFKVSLSETVRKSNRLKSSWGDLPTEGASITCKQVLDNPKGYFIALPGDLTGVGRIMISWNGREAALKPSGNIFSMSAVIDPVDDRGNYLLKATSEIEVAKRLIGLGD